MDSGAPQQARPQRWLRYYVRKRALQQWMQLELLGRIPVETVLEIGPALGAVTALLANAGYSVTTLDRLPRQFDQPTTAHIETDLMDLQPEQIAGHQAILCCETLEHLDWEDAGAVLRSFHASGAQYLITSVPYMGLQLAFNLYANPRSFQHYFSFKKFSSMREFKRQPKYGHQWEVGYRGYSLRNWERRIEDAGWRIVEREFTAHCRSVFHLSGRSQ
jgi:hypothetical protein